MVANHVDKPVASVDVTEHLEFAGDDVRLAGQIDYPKANRPRTGYPLLFVIPHGTSMARTDYDHIAELGASIGVAVFRWDKRGTGRSGHGVNGSIEIDTVRAYDYALQLPSINPEQVIIYAQNEGTLLLHDIFSAVKREQHPLGVLLAGNMLDHKSILKIDVQTHIVVSKNDWNDWRTYAEKAADAHADKYDTDTYFFVAMNTNRLLMYSSGNTFHKGAETSMKQWLERVCQTS